MTHTRRGAGLTIASLGLAAALALTACSSSKATSASGTSSGSGSPPTSKSKPLIGLIMKTNDVAYWQMMQKAAGQESTTKGLKLQVFAGAR